jgi:hypothetical protein
LNTFDDDNDPPRFDEPRQRAPRERSRRPQRSGPRRTGPAGGPNSLLRLAGLVALGIVIVFGFVLWVGSCSGQSTDSYTSYINAMQPLAKSSASVGKDFAKALGTPGLTMPRFQSDLASWSQQEQQAYVTAQKLQPPGTLQSAHAQALATFQLRYTGLQRLASTLAVGQQKHVRGGVVAAALASDAQLFSASDTVWDQLYRLPAQEDLKAQNITGVIVPPSRIVTDPAIVSAPQLATFYERLATPSTGTGAAGTHDLHLIGANAVDNGVSTPLSTSSTVTVSVGPSLVIQVAFKNAGSSYEVRIPVTIVVKAGKKILTTQRKTLAQIAPGAQATVPFTNLQLGPDAYSRFDTSISVHVGPVPREVKRDDNAATYPVRFRVAPS